ncbi:MAG TPA: prephenate dehydratase [Fermentimonas caenicola]|jgi:prephenate dehydratase|uniref:prephenate dehydratase n=1 Tax=Fermentimonas caenicola TaxID=1562970 RepID=A0A098C4D3_9BACT|nr:MULTISPECIES: prephenate dehydratase [Lascolabacillus]MBP6175880.1 prephenate dehydratase [Fermentimonas sp.]MDI9625851.1 prephenate dehydratase [Bacteroidota bacterium]TAH62287.1 MAG: prephenate dehydratase [Fermentimonas caenicola]MBP6197479.1 prephenate dehydratase [Fermentimonas sp.]MBP7103781.1 prephenate dehydratase [Fermentimonas sp.]
MKRVAIQGGVGAYHEIAAREYFKGEELEIVPCSTFKDIFIEAEKDPDLIGIMAIENTIAGSLLQNHDLLKLNKLQIAGEQKQRISHSLAVLPGVKIDEVQEVMSHPMALMQCEEFLDTLTGIKIVEHDDTALAARDIKEKNMRSTAAICSSLAAKIYGLDILAEGIETNKRNFTRFLILAKGDMLREVQKENNINKSSLVFILPHNEGSLSKVLSVLSFYGINLTRIQSLPIVGREWEYQFYIDLTFSDYNRYKQSIDAIMPLISNLKVLGEYREEKHKMNQDQ